MGLIRGGLFVVVCVLFFVSLLLANSLFTISSSLEYENIQKELSPVVTNILEEEIDLSGVVEEKLPEIEEYCENNSEFVFSEEGQAFEFSCDSAKEGTDAIINESIDNFVEDVYYKDYDCKFLNCFKEQKDMPFFLISENTQNYFQGKLYGVIFILLILLASMFLLVENKTNLPFIVGSLLIISSLPFLKLENFALFFTDKSYLQFFTFLFTQSYFVFLVSLILGLIILGLGVVLKFFVVGFKVSSLIDKFKSQKTGKKEVKGIVKEISKKEVKNIVKEEISKTTKKSK